MANTAENEAIEELKDDKSTDENLKPDDNLDDVKKDEVPEEDEIVLKDETPASKTQGIPRRVGKLLTKLEKEKEVSSAKDAEIELLKMQLNQGKPKADKPPTLADCDHDEDVYQQKVAEYYSNHSVSLVDKRFQEFQESLVKRNAESQNNQNLNDYYEEADKLNVSDFDDAETKLIGILGKYLVKDIAATLGKDGVHLNYWLSKNEGKAYELAELSKTNSKRLTFELGKLAGGLTKRSKSKQTPDPATKVEGSAAPGSASHWQTQLEKARDKTAETGDFSHVQKVKLAAKDAGVTL